MEREGASIVARCTVYIPDQLKADMDKYLNGENVSQFIQTALEQRIAPLRPRCEQCEEVLATGWAYCPTCGAPTHV